MTTYVIYANANDWQLSSFDGTYATAVAGSNLSATTGGSALTLGQNAGVYNIYESFLQFDTSAVDPRPIQSAELRLAHLSAAAGAGTINYHDDTWTAGDIAEWKSSATGLLQRGSFSYLAGATGTITDSFTDVSALPRSSTYQLVLLPGNLGIQPTGDEDATIKASEATGTTDDPRLTIETFPPSYFYSYII